MAKKKFRFLIKDRVQGVGCRGLIIAEMLNCGFEKGTAVNLPNGKVEVRIEGEKKEVMDFIKILKEELLLRYPNPKAEVETVKVSEDFNVPDIMRSSQAHLLMQFDKAIGILESLPTAIATELKNELPKNIAAELKPLLTK